MLLWQSIPEPLRDPVALAAPFFLVLIAIEGLAASLLEDERPTAGRRGPDGRAMPLTGGYDRRDALAGIGAGAVSIAHRVRVVWATHQAHRFRFSAYRRRWCSSGSR